MTPFKKAILRAIEAYYRGPAYNQEYIEAIYLAAEARAYGSNTSSCGICGGNHRSRDCSVSN